MRTAEHLVALDASVGQLDARIGRLEAKVDKGFAAVDERFAAVDARFEQIDRRFEQVDRRFDEQGAQMRALFEASRADFNNLYDFVRAQAQRTELRFDQIEADSLTRTADLHVAIAALAPRLRRTGRRR